MNESKSLLDRFMPGELRARLVAQILRGNQATDPAEESEAGHAPSAGGSVAGILHGQNFTNLRFAEGGFQPCRTIPSSFASIGGSAQRRGLAGTSFQLNCRRRAKNEEFEHVIYR
jgi:hypothetical protein